MDGNNLISLYDEMIQEPKETVVLGLEHMQTRPVIYNQILTPKDKIIQNSLLPYTLQVDIDGAHNFISLFQDFTKKYPQCVQNMGAALLGIYMTTLSYFGLDKLARREEAYKEVEKNSDGMITAQIGRLSAFQGNGSAQCSERSAAVHNLLSVLYRNGNLGNYEPFIALSKINDTLHAFNILRDEKEKKTIFFDTSYLVKDKDGVSWCGIFSVTDENYKKFIRGKKIKPQLITPRTEGVDNGKRQYGIENDEILNEVDKE